MISSIKYIPTNSFTYCVVPLFKSVFQKSNFDKYPSIATEEVKIRNDYLRTNVKLYSMENDKNRNEKLLIHSQYFVNNYTIYENIEININSSQNLKIKNDYSLKILLDNFDIQKMSYNNLFSKDKLDLDLYKYYHPDTQHVFNHMKSLDGLYEKHLFTGI